MPRNSLAYQTALTKPPDGRPHPTFHLGRGTAASESHNQNDQTKAKFLRSTHATLYRLATGHAFIGAYTQRFFPQHTPEQVACECGEQVQTVEHVLLHCPRHIASRRKHLTANGRPHGLSQLFTQPRYIEGLLGYLEETGVCAKPWRVREPG